MIGRSLGAVALLLAMLLTGVLPPTTATASAQAPAPSLSAHAATLVDETSGQVLYGRAASARLAPASTTKLMVALLVAESGRYFDRVTIERADLVGGSSMGLVSGAEITVRELMDGLLLASGNDASYALARHFGADLPGEGGPVSRFVARMNDRALELGLTGTSFRNPAGLDAEDHYSTAADLARLARAALRQPVVAQVVATPGVSGVIGQKPYTLRNTNDLIGSFPGALGVKTGTTDAAGECLIALVERDGRRLLSVVLGSEDRYLDTKNLIEWGFARHAWVAPPVEFADAVAPRGYSASLAMAPAVPVPVDQASALTYRLLPLPPGSPASATVEVMLGGQALTTRQILLYPLGQTRRPLPGW